MSNYQGQPGYPPQGYQQQGYNQYPPQQGHPPPQNYGGPMQQQAYGNGPPQNFGAPPPAQHGHHTFTHPQHHGGPPPMQQSSYGPPPHGYGQPPPQQGFGGPPPGAQFPKTPASPGYDTNVKIHGNVSAEALKLRKAMKGFGTDEKTLIKVLSKLDPLQTALIRETYHRDHQRDLESDVNSETSGNFREVMVGLVAGPLMQDVYMLKQATKGAGTNEAMLNDILIGRSNEDMRLIKQAYQHTWSVALEHDIAGDLSGKTAQVFRMVLSAQRAEDSAPIDYQQLERDLGEIHRATAGFREDPIAVCSLLMYKSDLQIRALAQEFQKKYQVNLADKVRSSQTGHMEDAVILLIERASDRAMTDAVQIEDAMKGLGTRDTLLLNRILRVHWNRAHLDQVKRAYKYKYNQDLVTRVRGETSGDYERALVGCLE